MQTSDFDYELPEQLIAQHPAPERDAARLLVVHRGEQRWEHRLVRDLPDFTRAGDVLVVNDTKVMPARIVGRKSTGGRVEFLFLEEVERGCWDVLMRASRRPRPGTRIALSDQVRAEVLSLGEQGEARVRVTPADALLPLLERAGITPLPPYIRRELNDRQLEKEDRLRYQTVYARVPGAVAAPTAGLHFTPRLLDQLEAGGVRRATVTLHVGPGTFRPVSVDRLEDHVMHEERYELPAATVEAIESARAAGGRCLAVGSTSVRTLETVAARYGQLKAGAGRSDLFIHPPYDFRVVDAMLTNFHLPASTLLMMVCAFGGYELVMAAYREAVRERYRFYSYGDAMLLL